MKSQVVYGVPSILVPFLFAIGLTFCAGRASGALASQLLLAAIPCGLLGMSAALVIALIRTYEKRIGQLERKLEATSPTDFSPRTSGDLEPVRAR